MFVWMKARYHTEGALYFANTIKVSGINTVGSFLNFVLFRGTHVNWLFKLFVFVFVYSGKNIDTVNTTPTKVVMSLCTQILNKGHTLSTDNWYTSLDLAYNLLENNTHLVGTIRKSRKGLPKSVIETKLERGDFKAMENEDGITVMKWKDKRDVYMLSTKHSNKLSKIVKKGKEITEPKMILDYNNSKGSVDLSDQMGAYSSPLRKTVKWYRKLGIELLLNTAIVNAWIMYTKTKTTKMPIVEFRKSLVENLTNSFQPQQNE